jgi:hypothetical protein
VHGFGSGRCRQPGDHSTDGRKNGMPAFDRRHEAALAPQFWVGLSLTTAKRRRIYPIPDMSMFIDLVSPPGDACSLSRHTNTIR